MKKNKLIEGILSWKTLIILQLISTGIVSFLIYKLNILPFKYLAVVTVILAVLLLASFFLMRERKNWKGKRTVVGKLFSIILSISLIAVCFYVNRGDKFFKSFGQDYEAHKVSVVVLNDSKYDELKDLKGKKFSINAKGNGVVTANAIENIETELGSTQEIVGLNSFSDMAKNLYSKEVDAIILSEASRGLILEEYKDFDKETKVIYQTEINEKIDNALQDIDVTEETFTIYISGNDEYDEDSDLFDPATMGGSGKRSDVNMLVTINPKNKQILMTTVPRDTYIKLHSFNGKDKLTHASIYGIQESVNTLSEFFDCEINYYVKVNFSSLMKIIDALDGVTVNNPEYFRSGLDASSGAGLYTFEKGEIELDGFEALVYSRERQTIPDGDNGRGRNQQRVLSAIIKKAMSPSIITHYNSFLDAIEGSFETTLSDTQIKSLIQMQLNDMTSWDIQSTQLDVVGGSSTECISMPGSNLYVSHPVESSIEEITQYILDMENGKKIKVKKNSEKY